MSKRLALSEGSEHIVKMLNSGDGGNMIFEPAVIKVSKGDTIHFKAVDMAHNSATIEGMIPAGASSWASALSQDVSITLDTEGVYVYQCDPHAMMAMVGVIQVGEAVNMSEIKASAELQKSNFMMNGDRLSGYLASYKFFNRCTLMPRLSEWSTLVKVMMQRLSIVGFLDI